MIEIDEIELAASAAEAETGVRGSQAKIPLCITPQEKERSNRWSKEDDFFLTKNYLHLSEKAIAAELGRSELAVHLRIVRELHLIAPSKAPEILTAEQISWGLGVDSKTIHLLMDTGIMPRRLLPGRRLIRVIDRGAFLLWMLEPRHWCYFRPERVGELRRQGKRGLADCYDYDFWQQAQDLIRTAAAKWRDEWLRPGQAAIIVGTRHGSKPINAAILRGTIKATRWGNWWILRSDLPAPDMTVNALGRIVPMGSIQSRPRKKDRSS